MTESWDWNSEIEIPSRLGEHLPFLEKVISQAESLGWEGRDHFGLMMTLEEVLTNAIRHGNGQDPSKRVHAECRLSSEHFWLSVEDEGQGFDPESVPDCTEDKNLHEFGGRGMMLIDAYMESVSFNERGNRITVQTRRGYRPADCDSPEEPAP